MIRSLPLNWLSDNAVFELGKNLAKEGWINDKQLDDISALDCFKEILSRDNRRPSEIHVFGGYDGDIVGAEDWWRDCIHEISFYRSNQEYAYKIRRCVLIDLFNKEFDQFAESYLSEVAREILLTREIEFIDAFAKIEDAAVTFKVSPGNAVTFTIFVDMELNIVGDIPLLGLADKDAPENPIVFSVFINRNLRSAGVLTIPEFIEGAIDTIQKNRQTNKRV